jgi:RHS repeat-associated protein
VDQKWKDGAATVIDRYQYGYDCDSNRLWRQNALTHSSTTNRFDEFYTYDGLNRLVNSDRGTLANPPSGGIATKTFQQQWGLDQVGNWPTFKEGTGTAWTLEQTRTNNAVNEITGITGGDWIVPAYDARGNMISGPKPGAETTRIHMKYDAWNRMVKVTDDSETPVTIAEYRYDGRNRRIAKMVRKVVSGNERWDRTDYYYNASWQVLEERFGLEQTNKDAVATAVKVQWVWSDRYIDAPVLRWRDTTGGGLNETLYYTNDANMNVTALVGTDGAVVERYAYDSYGKPLFLKADWTLQQVTGHSDGTASAYANEILYSGYRWDPESGAYDVRHRVYWWHLGRWGHWDRIVYGDGMNLYAFVSASPGNKVDPFGLETPTLWQKIKAFFGYKETVAGSFVAEDYIDRPETARYVDSGSVTTPNIGWLFSSSCDSANDIGNTNTLYATYTGDKQLPYGVFQPYSFSSKWRVICACAGEDDTLKYVQWKPDEARKPTVETETTKERAYRLAPAPSSGASSGSQPDNATQKILGMEDKIQGKGLPGPTDAVPLTPAAQVLKKFEKGLLNEGAQEGKNFIQGLPNH